MPAAQPIEDIAEEFTALTDACGEDPGTVCEWVFEATDNDVLARSADWVVGGPVVAAIILVGAWVVHRLVRRLIERTVEGMVEDRHRRVEQAQEAVDCATEQPVRRRALQVLQAERTSDARMVQRAQTIGTILRSLSAIVIFVLAGAIALGEIGINLAPLIAGAGIAGIALGFGAQTIVRDFLAGLFILVEDQYGVGDIVDVGEATGVIEEVQLRITKIRDLDGTLWYVPNGEIQRVANRSHVWSRAVMDVEVAYDTDLDLASEVIKRVADDLWREDLDGATIIGEPELWGVETFGASSIAIRLVARTDPGEQWNVARELRRRLKLALDEAGIEIPFPQRVVWMRNDDGGDEAAPAAALPEES